MRAPGGEERAAQHFVPVDTRAIRHFSHHEALPPMLVATAPTGYGKTVFLNAVALTLRRQGHQCLVHTLDEGDYDFDTAVRRIEDALGCGSSGVGVMFCGGPMIETDSRIDLLLHAAETLDHDVTLLIDGFDAARDSELGTVIERLALGTQAKLRIVVTGIEIPPETFHRVRLAGRLRELGPGDLCMGKHEIRELFSSAPANPLTLSDAEAEAIRAQTEGWPAAVRLMQVALSSRVDASALERDEDLDTSLTDTLSRRVLAAIDPALRTFLLQLADLRAFCPELCVHMTGEPAAADRLAELIRLNLLIFPATGRRGWFRFHGLFSDYLRREARVSRSDAERHEVLARALQWCRQHGELHDAFELALMIRDGAQASELLAARAERVVRDQGQHLFYIHAYERLLEIEPYPADEAQYWCGWALVFSRQYERAYRVLSGMRHGLEDPALDRMFRRKQALLSVILFSLDRIAEARSRGERWLEEDDGLNPFESSGVACVVGTAAIAELDMPTARRGIQQARNLMSRTGSEYGLAWISCLEALIDIEEGDLAGRGATLAEAIERARRKLGPAAAIVSTMELMAARIALESGEIEEARERVQIGLSQANHHGFIETARIGLNVAARLWDGSAESAFAPRNLDAIATSFPPRLQLILQCTVLVRLVRLGLIDAAGEWVRRQDMEGLLGARPPSFPASQLGSAKRALLAARLAWLVAQRNFASALASIEGELPGALKSGCASWQVHLLLTRLQVEFATGHAAQASKTLLRAIGVAAPRGLRQPFVEHADLLLSLLQADERKQWPLVNEVEFAFFEDLRRRIGAGAAAGAPAEQREAAPVAIDVDAPTAREVELLGLLDSGLSNQEIADRLGFTVGTVKWHLHNLFTKLRVRNRSAAIFTAKRAGLLNR